MEAFITGDLSDEVRLEIEGKLSDAEIWSEFLIIQKKLKYLAFEGAISPKDTVLDLLNKIVESNTSRKSNYMVAASLAIALISVVVAFLLYSKYTTADAQLVVLVEQNQ